MGWIEFAELYLLFLHFIQHYTICYGFLKKEPPYLVSIIDFLFVKWYDEKQRCFDSTILQKEGYEVDYAGYQKKRRNSGIYSDQDQ